jgi:hypothetical protein
MKAIEKMVKRCVRCGLPETFPGTKFDSKTRCNYCVYFDIYAERENKVKSILKKEFIGLITKVGKQKNKYDCIVAYSGGKDSTFLLYTLKTKFNLKILAHVLDNGFVSAKAMENIRRVTKNLGIDYKITRPDFSTLREVFNYALTEKIPYPKEILAMLSQVCAVCIGMVLGTTINLATKMRIPLMFVGFTPGQYPAITLENFLKVKSCMFISENVYKDDPLDVLKIISDPIRERFGEKVNKYFFKSQYVNKGLFVPKILLPYHATIDYDEKEILKKIEPLGWQKPKDTDSCSTNCLLNTLGNVTSVKQFGYHPYIGELSYLVREGKISRREAIAVERAKVNTYTAKHCLEKLNLKLK